MAGPDDKKKGRQLELPLPSKPAEPGERTFRLIRGEGKKREETLHSRNDVVGLLLAAASDVLLKRITPDRGHDIQKRVDRIMRLFERSDRDPVAAVLLRRELDSLEAVWREGNEKRTHRPPTR